MEYDVEKIDPTQNQSQLLKRPTSNRAMMAFIAVMLFGCGLCGFFSWRSSSSTPEPTPTVELAQTLPDGEQVIANVPPNETPMPLPTPEPPTPTPTNTAIPCDPAKCPSLIGLITYEYILRAGQPTPIASDPRTYTQMFCPYSNIVLDTTGQRFYLVLDQNYRFPGDPTSRLGQFLIELTDMPGCHYPVALLRDYYPFDQNVPSAPMTRVGEGYQQPGLNLGLQIATPTATPSADSPFNKPPMYYNTPLATATPTPPQLTNVTGRLTTISNCVTSNFGIATTSGELAVIFDFGAEMPPLGYNGEITLIGQQTQLCNRAAIKVTKAIYQATPTPLPFMPPATPKPSEPTRTPTPSPTPQTIRLTGVIMGNVEGCTVTDVGFTNRGQFYYLILDSLAMQQSGEATVLGQLGNDCPGQTIRVTQISFSTTPTPEAGPTVELFDDVGRQPSTTP